MRVIIAVGHGGIYSGGSYQSLWALSALKNSGVEVMAVWGIDIESDPQGFDRLKTLNIPFKLLPINHRATYNSVRQIRQIIKEFQPDVIECVKGKAQHHVLLASVGLNKHAIVYYRGVSQRLDFFQGLRYKLPRVDRLIANCQALKSVMVESGRINPDKIDVVYGQFDPACTDPDLVDARTFRDELNIPKGATLITQLGNWSSWRGQDVTIRAVTSLKRRGHDVHLLFAGRDTDKLNPLIREMGAESFITVSPFRRDPERILKATDIAVNASTAIESLPGALINVQAMGVPAVASAIPGADEVIEDGVTGIIVPVNEADSQAKALESLITIDRSQFAQMKTAARARAVRLFSSDTRVKRRMECYQIAINNRLR